MHFNEACKKLEAAGIKTCVNLHGDQPVELLFWDDGLDRWNSFCEIQGDETIPADAEADINELYTEV